ncbi:MAG: rod shape-determining protein RodA [Deltaproteobacteria bacterium]|nr:rod shape-determining protein RodA [Deltaproteobacteria bacterium]
MGDAGNIEVRTGGRHWDWPMLLTTMALLVIGLATLAAATAAPIGDEISARVVKQALFMGVGLVVMVVFAFVDARVFEQVAYVVYGVVLVLLLAVLLFAPEVNGSQRWLPLGGFRLQPSELAKIALVLAAARWFSTRPREDGWGLKELVQPAAMFLLPMAALTFMEPDLGTTLFLCFIFAGISFVVGLRWRTMAILVVIGTIAAPLAYQFVLTDYQRGRVDTLFAPEQAPKGKGYQAIQGRWAIGSGEVWGKGWRQGTQGRLKFLPEQHTDFIFSVYAEERGFVGSMVLLFLYFGQMLLGLLVAWNARDRFSSLLAAGIVTVLFCHVCINLGGVLGLLPITGVTLPLLSYGGSSILTTLVGIGMLLSVSMRRMGSERL